MGRAKKIQPESVLAKLRESNNQLRVADIAKKLKVSEATARANVRELRLLGYPILPTKEGLLLVDVVDEDNRQKIERSGDWVIGEIMGMVNIGRVAEKPLIQIRKVFKLSKEEKDRLKGTLITITNFITASQVEEKLK